MSYKPSRYNILLNREEPYLLFNTIRLSLTRVAKDRIDSVKRLLSSEKIEKTGNDDLLDKLVSGGYIISNQFDELNYLKLAYFKTKFNTDVLEIAIFVTKSCNFKCSYCFENTGSSEYITRERKESIIKFTEERIKKSKVLFLNWFGGEPLVRFNVIEELTQHFIQLCNTYSCQYAAHLTTNGYLLTPRVIEKLPKLQIKSIQTTLDGPREIHNRRRMLKGGSDTYDVILENVRHIVNNDIPVTIKLRCNVDKENITYIDKWLKTFPEDLKSKIHIGFAPVTPGGEENCPAMRRKDFVLNASDSGVVIPKFLHSASDAGFTLDFTMRRRNVYCNSDKSNQFIIGPDLSLIGCQVVMNKIGYITETGETKLDLAEHVNWLSKDPFNDNECKKCKLLPLCVGGCNLVRVRRRAKGCSVVKYNIEEWIRIMYKTTLAYRKKQRL